MVTIQSYSFTTNDDDKLKKNYLLKSMKSIQPCFCGSNCDFSSCCQPYINKEVAVQTAEQLMRSRFSAYALGNAQYIYNTYAKSSQAAQSVKEIDDWSQSCVWIALNIHPITNSVSSANSEIGRAHV